MYTVYILYSKAADKYYIGYTGTDIEIRLQKHLLNHAGFTGKFKDWNLVLKEQYATKVEAMFREQEIKRWKSRRRIEQLISEHPAPYAREGHWFEPSSSHEKSPPSGGFCR